MIDPKHLDASIEYITSRTKMRPSIALVLGSGLGDFADDLPGRVSIPTKDIPHYPQSTVEGHKGAIVFARLGSVPLVTFQGRIHFYESGNLDTVLYPIHVAHRLGVTMMIATNAAGGLNRLYDAGDLMVITDQINFTMQKAPPIQSPGVKHAPLYDPLLVKGMLHSAERLGLKVKKGVYVGLTGPSYETAAEVRLFGQIGGDAVGMSTVFEVELATQLGMKVAGVSCVTNPGTGLSTSKLNHQEVTDVANRVKKSFGLLLTDFIESCSPASTGVTS